MKNVENEKHYTDGEGQKKPLVDWTSLCPCDPFVKYTSHGNPALDTGVTLYSLTFSGLRDFSVFHINCMTLI
jgi:hypothetical protein